jgi:PIN domain nuclease of toxin-antitoxin system
MRLLLDTHVWLWACTSDPRLGAKTQAILESTTSTIFLSAASSWEASIKFALGKLQLPLAPLELVQESIRLHRLIPLPVSHEHSCSVSSLPTYHLDPFDRLLIGQALTDNLEIVTADGDFRRYSVRMSWALD